MRASVRQLATALMICAGFMLTHSHVYAQDRREPVAILVVDGAEIICEPVRGALDFVYSYGLEAKIPGQEVHVLVWLGTDDHPVGGNYWSGGSNGEVEWVEAGITARCDPLKTGGLDCDESSMTTDVFVAEWGLDPASGTVRYESYPQPLPSPPTPSSPQWIHFSLFEDFDKKHWLGAVYQYPPAGGAELLIWKWMGLVHEERGHHLQLGAEATLPTDSNTKIHRSTHADLGFTHDYWVGASWSPWPDHALLEHNSPPPTLRGVPAPDYFCTHMNTTTWCGAGSGPKAQPPAPPPCPATPTATPTPTSTPTPVPTAACPAGVDPLTCALCRNSCLVCCSLCVGGGGDCEACLLMELFWPSSCIPCNSSGGATPTPCP